MKCFLFSLLCACALGWVVSRVTLVQAAEPPHPPGGGAAGPLTAADCLELLEWEISSPPPRNSRACLAALDRWLALDTPGALRWVLSWGDSERPYLMALLECADRRHGKALGEFWTAGPAKAAPLASVIATRAAGFSPESRAHAALVAAVGEAAAAPLLDRLTAVGSVADAAPLLALETGDSETRQISLTFVAAKFGGSVKSAADLPAALTPAVSSALLSEIAVRKAEEDLPAALAMARRCDAEGKGEIHAAVFVEAAENQPEVLERSLTEDAARNLPPAAFLTAVRELAAAGHGEAAGRLLRHRTTTGAPLPDGDALRAACVDAPALLAPLAAVSPELFDRPLLRHLAKFDPAAAERLVSTAPADRQPDLRLALAAARAGDDPEGLISTLAADPAQFRSAGTLLADLSLTEPSAAWRMAKNLPEGEARSWALIVTSPQLTLMNPDEVRNTLSALPEGRERDAAMGILGITYAQRDPGAGLLILRRMEKETGGVSQPFLDSYLRGAAARNLRTAAEWLGKITDPVKRREAADWIMGSGQVNRHRFRKELEAAGHGDLLR